MALADDLRPVLHSIRSIPGSLGLRPHSVQIVTRRWSGEHPGEGTLTEDSVDITESGSQSPKVRWLTDEQRAVAHLDQATVEVGPITPSFSTGGTSLDDLAGADLQVGDTYYLRVTGPKHPNGALYRITEVNGQRAMHYKIRGEAVE